MSKMQLSTVAASLGLAAFASTFLAFPVSADAVTIPPSPYDNNNNPKQYWNYKYPWGDTHNGAARMVPGHVQASGAPQVEDQVHSGTIWAKEQVKVDESSAVGYEAEAEFIAPTAKGTWPANAASGWPPEIDIAELQATHTAKGLWKALDLIMDLQIQGSSGFPGPSGTTALKVRHVKTTRLTA
ncbi:hypothetical protein GLOTRDRAFT_95800 [Gloeophyllum trabeum ATCC 11539]|uniref:GH16 domain-containing protein n=1 Tax=Gloeophyllum trabeum (strain ATCC 11539 / FP-39264 / Madison 617) TaxID=670483 RepID=S7RD57_GLOTA|nr:uncharacterized protein GLOTRDRAFT_95800 [Gloeophyllum trabeum ATCC 11539]EPQ52140.1 hypothetical protein GLOTRDRAFT_95800 [Gloeophyllum trabeum ATCC 11539]